jgi:penicillin-binding protein 2
VLAVLILSLLATLLARLVFVQMLDTHKPRQSAGVTHLGAVAVPAPRGEIVDSRGRILVGNRSTHVVTVDRSELDAQPDHGSSVLGRLAVVLSMKADDLRRDITPCSPKVPAPCWTGQPYQPVPVATGISAREVLAVSEHAEIFRGVSVRTQTVLHYPGGSLGAHLLGYAGAVGPDDQKKNRELVDVDTIGRSGLEESYDSVLRGVDGQQNLNLDPRGEPVGAANTVVPKQGSTLVTSIDADVQKLAEASLVQQIQESRAKGAAAPSGALVVMDPHSGRVIAAASYPTYQPSMFIGGISTADFAKLTDGSANNPLVGRAIAGQYAPGSTFKLISASNDLSTGAITLDGQYPCPGSVNVDGRTKTNYEGKSFGGAIGLKFALQVSCDTFFYAPAVAEFQADQIRIAAGQRPLEQLQAMARSFGVASSPGVDLPPDEQATGSVTDRESRQRSWEQNKADYCAAAAKGYPNESNPSNRAYLTQLASENCTDGYRYFAGGNADLAIGQGDTTLSPLQLATAYSAMVNGGKLYAPTLGWGVVDGAGKVQQTITPKVVRTLPVKPEFLQYIGDSLHFLPAHEVSGAIAFDESPIKELIGGKTGTAEVYGKQDTSWFASWGPVKPGENVGTAKFVVVGMVEQAGLGSRAAAPMVRKVYEGLLGANGPAILPGSTPASTLPTITSRVQVATTSSSSSTSAAASDPPIGLAHDPDVSGSGSPSASSSGTSSSGSGSSGSGSPGTDSSAATTSGSTSPSSSSSGASSSGTSSAGHGPPGRGQQ